MRIAITGATGNAGTSVLAALSGDETVEEIVGGSPGGGPGSPSRARDGVCADVARDDLTEAFRGVDAVVHLAWLIQPSRDRRETRLVNARGERVSSGGCRSAGGRRVR